MLVVSWTPDFSNFLQFYSARRTFLQLFAALCRLLVMVEVMHCFTQLVEVALCVYGVFHHVLWCVPHVV